MSFFQRIPETVPDSTFALIDAFKADTNIKKINLSPGFYRDGAANIWVLPAVKKVW
jgi:aspartate aminotransferase